MWFHNNFTMPWCNFRSNAVLTTTDDPPPPSVLTTRSPGGPAWDFRRCIALIESPLMVCLDLTWSGYVWRGEFLPKGLATKGLGRGRRGGGATIQPPVYLPPPSRAIPNQCSISLHSYLAEAVAPVVTTGRMGDTTKGYQHRVTRSTDRAAIRAHTIYTHTERIRWNLFTRATMYS